MGRRKYLMDAKAIRTVALIAGLIAMYELIERIPDTKYHLFTALLFMAVILVVQFVGDLKEGASVGSRQLGIIKALAYISFMIFHALLAGLVMYLYGDTISAATFAVADTMFFLSSLYLLHLFFKRLYERRKRYSVK